MPEENIGHIRVFLFYHVVQLCHVINRIGPAVFLGKKPLFRRIAGRSAVAEMVIGDGDKAVLCQKRHECLISPDVLGYPMGNLHNTAHLSLGHTFSRIDDVMPGGGFKCKICKHSHTDLNR